MQITGEIVARKFTNKDSGEVFTYYVLEIELFDGSKTEVKLPRDVARLIVLSAKAERVLSEEH